MGKPVTPTPPAPTASEQVEFLGNIERLLAEGQFTATYKYALLVALADLAVEQGYDDGSELDLPVRSIGERFVEMYWRQALPFGTDVADSAGSTLAQSTGRQAAMVTRLMRMQRQYPTLVTAKKSADWQRAVREAANLVTTMPLWRLQVVGGRPHEFLYSRSPRRGYIRLRSGASAHLRRFHGLVVRLAQAEWLRFVQEVNERLLGANADLAGFLFGTDRRALNRLREGLKELQLGSCFYCRRALQNYGDVEHFIPWSRYPRDLSHNFVLAHANCNSNKRDRLAAEVHLERWVERSVRDGSTIVELGNDAGFISDWLTSQHVARWCYSHAASTGAQVWTARDQLEPLGDRWRALLA